MSDIRETIRSNLAKYIRNSKYTQADIARMLSVSKPTVSNWINGTNSPNIEYLEPLCSLLNVSISDIFSNNSDPFLLSSDEHNLIGFYRTLNDEGKEKARDYLADLASLPKYKKCSESRMDKEA